MADDGFRKKHILVVDDEEGIRVMLETRLGQEGYTVSSAASGKHALQKLRANKDIDLIICDLKMAGMSGTELYQQVNAEFPNVPFFLITGFPEKKLIMEAVKTGVKALLIKPVKHAHLLEKIKTYIGEGSTIEPAA